uniref:Protein FAM186A n=1 Tax=Pogona vitticeps TaxID=103695 RepID=A0ABM5FNN0_9SAUR
MAFQKFVAWEHLPSLAVRPDAVGSSSSSSKSESGSAHDSESDDAKLKATTMKPEIVPGPIVEIPPSVKNVLEKLDMAQLERAKKDVSKKLYRIMDNVNRTYERYRKDEGIDPEIEKEYQLSQSWEERSRRSHLLDEIADVLDDSRFKIQELEMVLESFKNLYESLKTIDWREREAPSDGIIDEMEERLLNFINSIDANIKHLIKIFYPLFEEKIKPRRKSTIRPSLFKAWRDKVADTPKEGEPLTLEKMLEDEPLTLAHCNEVSIMLHEMTDCALFNRAEYVAIKYIATMVANLTKAFSLLSKQCRGLKIKYDSLLSIDSRKQDPQVVQLQKELRAALEKKAALEMQVHKVEERCKILLITNETMQKELQDANERGMLVSKVSFPKVHSGKTPERILSDQEKKLKSKEGEQSPVKLQAPSIPELHAKPEEREMPIEKLADEQGKREKLQATVPEKTNYLPPPTISTQDGGIKMDKKDQEKDTFPEVVPTDISSDKHQPEIAQKSQEEKGPLAEDALKSPEEKSPLEEKAPKSPEEKSPLEEKAPKSPEEKGPLEEKAPKSPEEEAPLEEEAQKSPEEKPPTEEHLLLAPPISTTTEDRPSLEKDQALISKRKIAKVVRRSSKLSQWKKLQTSLITKSTKPSDEPSQPPEESSIISDDASVVQPAPAIDTEVSQPATLHDTTITQPTTLDDTSVTQPATLDDRAVTQPTTLDDTSVTQPATLDDRAVIQPTTLDDTTQPATLDDIAVAQPAMLDDTKVTKSASLHDAGESSPQASVDSAPKPRAEEDSTSTSPEVESPPLSSQPTESTPGPSVKSEGTRGKRSVSLRGTAGKLVQTMKVKKIVKFIGEGMVPDSRERSDAESPESPQPGAVEGAEESSADAQEAGTMQVQKRLTGKSKEIREKKDTKRTSKMLAGILQSKQAERTEEVLQSLGTKLQETARDRGGVIDTETIKDIFEELGIAYPDIALGQVTGSHPIDKPGKGYTAKRLSLVPSVPEQALKKERRRTLEEVPSGQDISCALQEFQTAILACIEDKLEKAKTGSLGTQKRLEPTDPQVQQLFQAIDKKLEECFSMKQKIMRSVQSKEELLDGEEREIEIITSLHDTPSAVGHLSSGSSLSVSRREREEPTTSGDASHLEAWEEKELEQEMEQEIGLEKGGREKEKKEKKQEKEQEMEVKREPLYQKERLSPLDGHLPKLEEEEEEDYYQMSPPHKEKRSLEDLPDERHLLGRASSREGKKHKIIQPSDELQTHLRRRKEPLWKESKPVAEMESLQELDEGKELLHMQLQEQLEREKEQLQEELRQLQEERQRLEEEEKHLEQWKQMCEQQQVQWEYQQQQHKEQEHLWQVQLQHWQHLQQENEAQAQHWSAQREQQKEQQDLLQQEIERLQQEYREYLKMRGEQAEEQWRWNQLKAWHEQQAKTWQEEDEEQERKRHRLQEQLAQHEEQLEALRQERQEQEQALKRLQQEQQERQEALQHLWEKRWRRQLESWHRQMQRQRAQQYKWQEHSKRLQERQQQLWKEAKSPAPKLKVVEGSALDQFSKQEKVSPTSRERHPSTTPQLTPIPSTEFEEDTLELETTWFPKLFTKAGDFSAPGITEKRYWINVEAQRKNLELLKEAAKNAGVSSELYSKAKAMINQALHSDVERLGLLFQKYTSFYHLQEARRNLTIQLDAAKDIQDGVKMQNLYKMVEKLDSYQKKVLDNWTAKQNAVEKKRRRCLEKMIALFAQLRLSTKLHLSYPHPLMIKAGDSTKKEILHMPRIGSVFLKPKVYSSPLISVKKPPDFTFSAVVREPSSEQLTSLWNTDITKLSIPLGPKTPVSVLWSEACGFPDIPRLLELDISSIRKKPLQNIKTRIQSIPRWKISGYNFMHL